MSKPLPPTEGALTCTDHAALGNTGTGCFTPVDFAAGKVTATMEFPRSVVLTTEPGVQVHYLKGIHEVPREYAEHWFLKANGVAVVENAAAE